MYKTKWLIHTDNNELISLTYYHFGKKPKFPPHYLKENVNYEIWLALSFKLINTPKIFIKCLLHKIVIEERK